MLQMTLRYDGRLADDHAIDFYDATRALTGFERSLALVTHLAINGENITQAPSLKNAQIITTAPEEGSWKVTVGILGALFTAASVGKDSPVGQVVTSLYDYVLSSTMGFHVDYNKTLQQQIAEHRAGVAINEGKVKSLVEKCESSVIDMHRPIVASRTASTAIILATPARGSKPFQLGPDMTAVTYDYLMGERYSDQQETFTGKVSSYNVNTFKGRMFVVEEWRTIAFELTDEAKTPGDTGIVTLSLRLNNADKRDKRAVIEFTGYRTFSKNGRLKAIRITSVRELMKVE